MHYGSFFVWMKYAIELKSKCYGYYFVYSYIIDFNILNNQYYVEQPPFEVHIYIMHIYINIIFAIRIKETRDNKFATPTSRFFYLGWPKFVYKSDNDSGQKQKI